jgi:hypothetical protein
MLFEGLEWSILFLYALNKFWCQLPEDGDIMTPKHVGSMQKIASINCRLVHFVCVT